jgi:hypothetical protein
MRAPARPARDEAESAGAAEVSEREKVERFRPSHASPGAPISRNTTELDQPRLRRCLGVASCPTRCDIPPPDSRSPVVKRWREDD